MRPKQRCTAELALIARSAVNGTKKIDQQFGGKVGPERKVAQQRRERREYSPNQHFSVVRHLDGSHGEGMSQRADGSCCLNDYRMHPGRRLQSCRLVAGRNMHIMTRSEGGSGGLV
jgi:hypothetical protein